MTGELRLNDSYQVVLPNLKVGVNALRYVCGRRTARIEVALIPDCHYGPKDGTYSIQVYVLEV
jgi:hypothetical protein